MQKATCVTILLNGTLPFLIRIDYAEGLTKEIHSNEWTFLNKFECLNLKRLLHERRLQVCLEEFISCLDEVIILITRTAAIKFLTENGVGDSVHTFEVSSRTETLVQRNDNHLT